LAFERAFPGRKSITPLTPSKELLSPPTWVYHTRNFPYVFPFCHPFLLKFLRYSAMSDQCKLLGPFSLFVQAILGLLSLSSLLFKRYQEYPHQRPWLIWFFDVSKQVFGSLGIHILNVIASIIFGGDDFDIDDEDENPCDYYFLNILFDTTVGIPILWLFLWMIYNGCSRLGIEGIVSGQYGNPPKLSYYFKQLALYILGLFLTKSTIYLLLLSNDWFYLMADWILSWTEGHPRLQLFIVLMIFPLIMNAIQYYIVDNILKSPEYSDGEDTAEGHVSPNGLLNQGKLVENYNSINGA